MSRHSHQLLHITGAAAARDQLGTPSERTGNLPALRGYLSSSSWALKAVTCAYTSNMPAPGGVWVVVGTTVITGKRAANRPAPQRNVFDTRSGALAGTVRSWLGSLGLRGRIAGGRGRTA